MGMMADLWRRFGVSEGVGHSIQHIVIEWLTPLADPIRVYEDERVLDDIGAGTWEVAIAVLLVSDVLVREDCKRDDYKAEVQVNIYEGDRCEHVGIKEKLDLSVTKALRQMRGEGVGGVMVSGVRRLDGRPLPIDEGAGVKGRAVRFYISYGVTKDEC